MARYWWDRDAKDWVDYAERVPHPPGPLLHYVIPDTPDYQSPVTGERVSGRVQRREDLKRSGCVPWEPGIVQNPVFQREPGLVLNKKYEQGQLRHDPEYRKLEHRRRDDIRSSRGDIKPW